MGGILNSRCAKDDIPLNVNQICQDRNLSELEFVRISNYLIGGQKCYVKLT